MKFRKGNNIIYGQDFGWHVGVPEDIEFTIKEQEWTDDLLFLEAPGYGLKPYGNGSICVYLKTKKEKTEDKPKKDDIEKKFKEFLKILEKPELIAVFKRLADK